MKEGIQQMIFTTTEGYNVKIIEYNGWYNSKIEFDDGTILDNIILGSLKKGNVKNPNHKSVYSIGYLGIGSCNSKGIYYQVYNTWKSMFQRCYDKKYQDKQPTYKGCLVVEEWHNFQVFAEWHKENYNPKTMEGWQLDKDLLSQDNKIYSPKTCCFLPKDINLSLQNRKGKYLQGVRKKTNKFQSIAKTENGRINLGSFETEMEAFEAYRTAKERYIKYLADKYKDAINSKVYEALYNYKVEITD